MLRKGEAVKKRLNSIALMLASCLLAGTALAQDIKYEWRPSACGWVGGCRYTYQVPPPPAGKKWALDLSTSHSVNDGNVWMTGTAGRVVMDRWGQNDIHRYKGHMPTGGEVEFWMPANAGSRPNRANINGHLIDVNTPPEPRPPQPRQPWLR